MASLFACAHGSTVAAQELDVAPLGNNGNRDGAAIILGLDGKLDLQTMGTAALTRQDGSSITAGLAQFEWKPGKTAGLLAAVGYAVRDGDMVTHAVVLRAGGTYQRQLSKRLTLKAQTLIEVLLQDRKTQDIARLRSRFELGYRLLPASSRKPILFASAEPIVDQRYDAVQQLRLQGGLMAAFGRFASQIYYRREEVLRGAQRARNAVFVRGILRIGGNVDDE